MEVSGRFEFYYLASHFKKILMGFEDFYEMINVQ